MALKKWTTSRKHEKGYAFKSLDCNLDFSPITDAIDLVQYSIKVMNAFKQYAVRFLAR